MICVWIGEDGKRRKIREKYASSSLTSLSYCLQSTGFSCYHICDCIKCYKTNESIMWNYYNLAPFSSATE